MATVQYKICKVCNERKFATEFVARRDTCRLCFNEQQRSRQEMRTEYMRQYRTGDAKVRERTLRNIREQAQRVIVNRHYKEYLIVLHELQDEKKLNVGPQRNRLDRID